MPRLLLMGDIVLRCQRRSDMEGNSVLSTPEWKALISEQYAQLYGIVVKSGMRYFETTATIIATGATSYALPSDHDETIGIDRVMDSLGRKVQLGEMMVQERNAWSGQTADAVAYSLVGQTIVFFPRPTTGTYQHVYVAQSPDISAYADTATVDVVTGDGEAFLIWGVAAKALPKTESDTTSAVQEREAASLRFADDVQMRALVNPRRRIVMRGGGNGGGWGGENGGFGGDVDWTGIDGGWWNH
jgi:hypothetical protein